MQYFYSVAVPNRVLQNRCVGQVQKFDRAESAVPEGAFAGVPRQRHASVESGIECLRKTNFFEARAVHKKANSCISSLCVFERSTFLSRWQLSQACDPRNFEQYANKEKAKHGEGHMPIQCLRQMWVPDQSEAPSFAGRCQ